MNFRQNNTRIRRNDCLHAANTKDSCFGECVESARIRINGFERTYLGVTAQGGVFGVRRGLAAAVAARHERHPATELVWVLHLAPKATSQRKPPLTMEAAHAEARNQPVKARRQDVAEEDLDPRRTKRTARTRRARRRKRRARPATRTHPRSWKLWEAQPGTLGRIPRRLPPAASDIGRTSICSRRR